MASLRSLTIPCGLALLTAALAGCEKVNHAAGTDSAPNEPQKIDAAARPTPAERKPLPIADRASCSTLCQAKQPLETALAAVGNMGYRWVDVSCLFWTPHVSVAALLEDFDKEASRVESALAANGLRASNLTFDNPDRIPFDQYQRQFDAVVKLAVRTKAHLINIMAPAANSDRHDAVVKLRTLQDTARRSGILLTLETHCNQITEKPADALWLCQQVPGLGLTLDPSHYYAGPNQGKDFDFLYPFVKGTGFRAGGMNWATIQMPWGEGPIDFTAVVRKLEAAGYKGFYVAEYIEGFNSLDALVESRRFLEWTRTQSRK